MNSTRTLLGLDTFRQDLRYALRGLRRDAGFTAFAVLIVANAGPPLPAGMEERLFESMVSVRAGNASGAPHLGLGLYIVRLIAQFHGGAATAENRVAPPGVAVIVRLPLAAA